MGQIPVAIIDQGLNGRRTVVVEDKIDVVGDHGGSGLGS
jgi:hypothetical protein